MKALSGADFCVRLAAAWLACAALMAALLAAHSQPFVVTLDTWFLHHQDLPVLWTVTLAAFLVLVVGLSLRGGATEAAPRRPALAPATARRWVLAVALAAGLIGLAGHVLVMDSYPLSMDEFMAGFDAQILAHGQLMAPVSAPWRNWLDALQPQFVTLAPGNAAWSSQYLPVNAALHGAGLIIHAPWLVSPALAAIAVVALYAVGVRLFPGRPGLALGACVLMASSSQFLLTAMTPYAMTAHLAFNLVWLALHLRGGRLGHAGAIAIGFLACGLHQFIFHPLFAAPFVLELAIARRWRLFGLYGIAYPAILAFWIGYPQLALSLSGAPPAQGGAAGAAAIGLVGRLAPLLESFGPGSAFKLDENLIRFATWQNLALIPLLALGLWPAIKAAGAWRALVIGLILTAAAMLVIIPYQGHGWGWRYLHGLLGSAALIAVLGLERLASRLDASGVRVAHGAMIGLTAISLAVLLPLRAAQAHGFVTPYARAFAAILKSGAQVVVVDPAGAWFADDFTRNDPYLRRRPLMINAGMLSRDQLAALCRRPGVVLFDAAEAMRFGVSRAGAAGAPSAGAGCVSMPLGVHRRTASATKLAPEHIAHRRAGVEQGSGVARGPGQDHRPLKRGQDQVGEGAGAGGG
jgi:hypothetical protein